MLRAPSPAPVRTSLDVLCGQAFAPLRGLRLGLVTHPAAVDARTGLAVLAALRGLSGESFTWRLETYEFVADGPAIDLLFGSDRERQALDAGRSSCDIARAWEAEEEAFRQRRRQYLLY